MGEDKTVVQWLDEAKKQGYEWAENAIFNHENQEGIPENAKYSGQRVVECLPKAVISAFRWSLTKQGFHFWDKIYNDLLFTKDLQQ